MSLGNFKVVTCDIVDSLGKNCKHSFIFSLNKEDDEVEDVFKRLLTEAQQSISRQVQVKSPYTFGISNIIDLEPLTVIVKTGEEEPLLTSAVVQVESSIENPITVLSIPDTFSGYEVNITLESEDVDKVDSFSLSNSFNIGSYTFMIKEEGEGDEKKFKAFWIKSEDDEESVELTDNEDGTYTFVFAGITVIINSFPQEDESFTFLFTVAITEG